MGFSEMGVSKGEMQGKVWCEVVAVRAMARTR